MDQAKVFGGFLCFTAVALTAILLWGLAQQQWWAVALPVGALVVAVMTMLFWVGWTFITTDSGPPQ